MERDVCPDHSFCVNVFSSSSGLTLVFCFQHPNLPVMLCFLLAYLLPRLYPVPCPLKEEGGGGIPSIRSIEMAFIPRTRKEMNKTSMSWIHHEIHMP